MYNALGNEICGKCGGIVRKNAAYYRSRLARIRSGILNSGNYPQVGLSDGYPRCKNNYPVAAGTGDPCCCAAPTDPCGVSCPQSENSIVVTIAGSTPCVAGACYSSGLLMPRGSFQTNTGGIDCTSCFYKTLEAGCNFESGDQSAFMNCPDAPAFGSGNLFCSGIGFNIGNWIGDLFLQPGTPYLLVHSLIPVAAFSPNLAIAFYGTFTSSDVSDFCSGALLSISSTNQITLSNCLTATGYGTTTATGVIYGGTATISWGGPC